MRLIIGRPPTSWFEVAELERLYNQYGIDKCREALKTAKKQNKFSIAYFEAVLEGKGYKSKRMKEIEAMKKRLLEKYSKEDNKGGSQ